MKDFMIVALVAVLVGAAIVYIIRAKKSGVKCIGCPDAKKCCGSCQGGCKGCSHNVDETNADKTNVSEILQK